MASDVCKHCTHAGCLDVCPTGALFRTEFGTVVVQDDVCNGCGYCVAGLPVRRDRAPRDGTSDRQSHGISTGRRASASAGTLDADHERRHRPEVHALLRPARRRPDARVRPGLPDDVDQVRRPRRDARHARGPGSRSCTSTAISEARLYGVDDNDGVGGTGSMFLLLDEPEVYGLPPDPRVHDRRPARHVPQGRLRGADDARDGSGLVRREAQVTTNPFDADRPPERPRRRGDGGGARGGGERRDESMMVPDVSFDSYYGRHIVKPAPWEKEVAAYLFLGGIAAGSALLGAGGAARRLPRAAARRAHRRRRRRCPRRGGARQGPRQAEPRPQHDADRQAHLADVGRVVDPDRVRQLRQCGSRLRGRAPAARAAFWRQRIRRPQPGLQGAEARGRAGHRGVGVLRAPARRLHGGAARRHGDPDVARVLPRAAVRLRQLRQPRGLRARARHRAVARERPSAQARRRERGRRAGGLRTHAGPARADALGAAAHRQGRPRCSRPAGP